MLQELGIGTVAELCAYLAILTGSTGHVAVDMHIAGFVCAAGIDGREYSSIQALILQAAEELECSVSALDAAIWNHNRTNLRGSTDG